MRIISERNGACPYVTKIGRADFGDEFMNGKKMNEYDTRLSQTTLDIYSR